MDESVFRAAFAGETVFISFEVVLGVGISAAVEQETHHLKAVTLRDEFVRLRDLLLRRIDQLLHGGGIDRFARRIPLPAVIRIPRGDRFNTFCQHQIVQRFGHTIFVAVFQKRRIERPGFIAQNNILPTQGSCDIGNVLGRHLIKED